MNLVPAKAKDAVKATLGHVRGAYAVLCVLMLVAVSSAATDFSTLTTGVEADISGISTILMGIAAAIIGVSLVFVGYRFIKRMLGG